MGYPYLPGLEDDLQRFDEDLFKVVIVDEVDLVIIEVLEVLVLPVQLHHLVEVGDLVLDEAFLELSLEL